MPQNATIKTYPTPAEMDGSGVPLMKLSKFWPLDYDPEDEVYETLVWDLPGYRKKNHTRVKLTSRNTVDPRRSH